jgi:hypothetical protein
MSKLANIISRPELLVSFIATSVLFLLLAVMGFVLGKIFMGVVFLVLLCVPLALLFYGYTSRQQELTEDAGEELSAYIKTAGIQKFSLDDFQEEYGYSKTHIHAACENVYEACVGKAIQDAVITDKERKTLNTLRGKLKLTASQAAKLELSAKKNKYKVVFEKLPIAQVATKQVAVELKKFRSTICISDQDAVDATKTTITNGYIALLQKYTVRRTLSDAEFVELNTYALATGMNLTNVFAIAKQEVLDLYHALVSDICKDKIITDDEVAMISKYEDLFQIPHKEIANYRTELNLIIQLTNIKKGILPTVRTDKLINTSEICHWHSACRYEYVTPSGNRKEYGGELIVTNKRVIFNSDEKSFEFRPGKIIEVTTKHSVVSLRCSTKTGQGDYAVRNVTLLGAILEQLARSYIFEIDSDNGDSRSRHIPDHVKVAVYQRDGGRCVKCGSDSYLEYDHIIPFSKGGANSENNIQLLCRGCNLKKSNNLV